MKQNIKIVAVLAVIALFGGSTVAYAQVAEGSPHSVGDVVIPHGPGIRNPNGQGVRPGSRMGSTTGEHGDMPGFRRPGAMGSTTGMHGELRDMRKGSTTEMMRPEGFRGVPGIVTEVASNHFTISSRGLGKGTTTLMVTIDSGTKFVTGSSTASYSDVIVGAKVEVLGKVATSTKTITAQRVRINNGQEKPKMMGDDKAGEQVQQGGGHPGFLNKFKKFLGGSDTSSTGGPAAVGAQGDFLGSLMDSLFGWMH